MGNQIHVGKLWQAVSWVLWSSAGQGDCISNISSRYTGDTSWADNGILKLGGLPDIHQNKRSKCFQTKGCQLFGSFQPLNSQSIRISKQRNSLEETMWALIPQNRKQNYKFLWRLLFCSGDIKPSNPCF